MSTFRLEGFDGGSNGPMLFKRELPSGTSFQEARAHAEKYRRKGTWSGIEIGEIEIVETVDGDSCPYRYCL